MTTLNNLIESLLASLAIVGAAALHMLLLLWIIFAAFLAIALLRWAIHVAWKAAVDGYNKRSPFR